MIVTALVFVVLILDTIIILSILCTCMKHWIIRTYNFRTWKNGRFDKDTLQKIDNLLTARSVPLIYRREHNIEFFGLEKFHSFDSCKFKKIFKFLCNNVRGLKARNTIKAAIVKEEVLRAYHTKRYLDHLKQLGNVEEVISFHIQDYTKYFLGSAMLTIWSCFGRYYLAEDLEDSIRRKTEKFMDKVFGVLEPLIMIFVERYQVGSTILAGELALLYKYAIVIGGDDGGGWCVYADIGMSIVNLMSKKKIKSALIIDLDAHRGNGHEMDKLRGKFGEDLENVFIIDIFHEGIYPSDDEAVETEGVINYSKGIDEDTTTSEYLEYVEEALNKAIDEPTIQGGYDIVFYNAGSDILEGDEVGQLSISEEGMVERDELVFGFFHSRGIPIVYVMSGGYTEKSVKVVGHSLRNLFQKFKLICN